MDKETKRSKGLLVTLTVCITAFSVVTIVIIGFATYYTQMVSYKEECEKSVRNVGEYLERLMVNEGQSVGAYKEYYMDHYREMEIPYDFDEFVSARSKFDEAYEKEYSGMVLGEDIQLDELKPELQELFYTMSHEYWLLCFENARENFDLAYAYFLVMGDDRARLESLEEGDDPKYNVVYMIDGERTVDKEKSTETEEYLYLGDTYENDRQKYDVMWKTWETGEKQPGPMEFDNQWGHTYGYYTPLIIDGEKIGLIVTEIDVATVNREILLNTLRQVGIISLVYVAGILGIALFINSIVIQKIKRLEKAVREYTEDRDEKIADSISAYFSGESEIDHLGKEFSRMIHDISRYMRDLSYTTTQLFDSKKRERELSERKVLESLSGIKDNNDYDREAFRIMQEISEGKTRVGVLIAKVPDLGSISERFGEMKADIAVKSVLKELGDVYDHSGIFRIEKDVFVVILKGDEYKNANELCAKLSDKFRKWDDNKEEWEAPKVFVGMSLYDEERDRGSYQFLFNRAKSEMEDACF